MMIGRGVARSRRAMSSAANAAAAPAKAQSNAAAAATVAAAAAVAAVAAATSASSSAASASSSSASSSAGSVSATTPSISAGRPKSTIQFSVRDQPGALGRVLNHFFAHGVNMTRLESRPSKAKEFSFTVSVEGASSDPRVSGLVDSLRQSADCSGTHFQEPRRVPWFPTTLQDVDLFANHILDAGEHLEADHPGFHDEKYRARRGELARLALEHRHDRPFPHVDYTPEETATWGAVYDRLMPLHRRHACEAHLRVFPELERHCGYARDNIPQVADISRFLQERTGFRLRPVAGLLSARDFLYGLAFRTFFSTQYIRHHSRPLYTPEPDICHELLGHAPLFADPDFADFSQEIGLAAIGATEDQIQKLARCYWYTVEFGLCLENGERKAFGAGLLSSFGELEYSMGPEPRLLDWDPFDASERSYPITTYQPVYYVASSFEEAKRSMVEFSTTFARPFNARYNDAESRIEVDANVRMMPLNSAPTK